MESAYVARHGGAWPETGAVLRWPTRRELGWITVGVVGLLGVQTGGGLLLQRLGVAPAPNVFQQLSRRVPAIVLWFVPVSLVVVGPAEEFLFRGIIQGRLRSIFRPAVAIPIASAIFALPHITALTAGGGAALATLGVVFVVSLGLGAAYERTGNLLVPMVMHGGYNAVLFGSLFLSLTG